MEEKPKLDAYFIMTQKGLNSQSLIDNQRIISSVSNPSSSIEQSLFEEYKEIPDNKPLFLGYDNTFVFIPGNESNYPITSMSHFFLAETISEIKKVRASDSLVDLGCGAGFLGNYAAKNYEGLKNGRIVFTDLFPSAINAAINAYLLNNNLKPKDVLLTKDNDTVLLSGNKNQVIEFLLGDVNKTLYGQEAEIAVSSPLYLPLIFEPFPGIFELFGEVSKHIGAEFYFSHTALADNHIEEAAHNTNAKLTEINMRKFPLHLVRSDPKTQSIITDDEKLEKLVSLGLKIRGKGEEEQFEHEIRVSRFNYE